MNIEKNYFLKIVHDERDEGIQWLLENELYLRVLLVCAQRARKSAEKSQFNNLGQWEFFLAETETNVFGLKDTQGGKIRRALLTLQDSKYISKVENKTGSKRGSVYLYNNDESPIYWGDKQRAEQRTDREQIENRQRGNKNDKKDKKDNISEATEKYITKFNELFGGRNFKMLPARREKMRARLETYSLEEILKALEIMATLPFYRGKNDSGWEADPDYLLQSDSKVDKMLNKEAGKSNNFEDLFKEAQDL